MRERRDHRLLVGGLVLSDAVALLLAAGAVVFVHTAAGRAGPDPLLPLMGLMLCIGVGVFALQGLYDSQLVLTGWREYLAVARGCAFGLAAVSLVSFGLHRPVSRSWIGLSWPLAAVTVSAGRRLWWVVVQRLRRHGRFIRRALLIGADASAVALAGQLNHNGSGMRVVGILDDYHPVGAVLCGVQVLGRPYALEQVAARAHAGDAIIVPQALPWETLHRLIRAAAGRRAGVRLHLSAGYSDLLTTPVQLTDLNSIPLLTVDSPPSNRWARLVRALRGQRSAPVRAVVKAE